MFGFVIPKPDCVDRVLFLPFIFALAVDAVNIFLGAKYLEITREI